MKNSAVAVAPPLRRATRLFVDSAPILYFLEGNATYWPVLDDLFRLIRARRIVAVTSFLAFGECLLGLPRLPVECAHFFTHGTNTLLLPIDRNIQRRAGQLRSRHGLAGGDALQIAAAIDSGCQSFLTNDRRLQAVGEIPVLVLDDLLGQG